MRDREHRHALQQGVETSPGFKARSEPATLNPWQQLLRDAAREIHAIPGAVHQHRIAGERAEQFAEQFDAARTETLRLRRRQFARSEERRVGTEWVHTGKSSGSP